MYFRAGLINFFGGGEDELVVDRTAHISTSQDQSMTVNILQPLTQTWQVGPGFRAAASVMAFFTALSGTTFRTRNDHPY